MVLYETLHNPKGRTFHNERERASPSAGSPLECAYVEPCPRIEMLRGLDDGGLGRPVDAASVTRPGESLRLLLGANVSPPAITKAHVVAAILGT